MIPENEYMLPLLIELEAEAHKQGWDNLPVILGAAFAQEAFVWSAPFPRKMQPTAVREDLIDGLDLLTRSMRYWRSKGEGREKTPPDTLCGLWLIGEAWSYDDLTVPPEKYADTVGAWEVRFGVLLDFGGGMHILKRRRGDAPAAASFTPGDEAPYLQPGMIPALRDLALEHALWMPDDAMDATAVSRWKDPEHV